MFTTSKNIFGRIGTEFHKIEDHQAHFQQQIKSICQSNEACRVLLIGRGVNDKQKWAFQSDLPVELPDFNINKSIRWVHLDHFGGAFSEEALCDHLWSDVNCLYALEQIPGDLFDAIVVDASTWRYLYASDALRCNHYLRILKTGGSLICESNVASMKFSRHVDAAACHELNESKIYYEHDNFCHLTLLNENSIEKTSQRIILPVSRNKANLSEFYILSEEHLPLIELHWAVFAQNIGFEQVKVVQGPYPIKTKWPIHRWMRWIK